MRTSFKYSKYSISMRSPAKDEEEEENFNLYFSVFRIN